MEKDAQPSLTEVHVRLIICQVPTVQVLLLVVGTAAHALMAVGTVPLPEPELKNQVTLAQHQQRHVKARHQGGPYSTMVQTNLVKPRFVGMDTHPVISPSEEIRRILGQTMLPVGVDRVGPVSGYGMTAGIM
jgi:hypothetical protein